MLPVWWSENRERAPLPMWLSVRNVSKSFVTKRGGGFGRSPSTLAVNDVSFDIHRGETLGLVGESGCGKTTLSKILMRGVTADEGEVLFNGEDHPSTCWTPRATS